MLGISRAVGETMVVLIAAGATPNLSIWPNDSVLTMTAFIGQSSTGDIGTGTYYQGEVTYHEKNIYDSDVDPIEVRRRIGMVFQKPNPFPKSIYDNVSYGPKAIGMSVSNMDDWVEESLTRAALWDEVNDKLKQSAYGLSGGQQQRLCIARTIAVNPR